MQNETLQKYRYIYPQRLPLLEVLRFQILTVIMSHVSIVVIFEIIDIGIFKHDIKHIRK